MQKDLNKLTEREKCELGMLYDANYSEETVKLRLKCQELCYDFNQIRPSDLKKQEEQIRKIVGKCGKSPVITAPFHCDNGFNIELGDYFYANYNLIILDGAKVTVGDHVWIGRNVYIAKNTQIPSHSIVGWCSNVTSRFNEENVIIAGNPAKIVKRQIDWKHERFNEISPC